MITHGRVHLLEEAVYSFLLQDYKNSELVIVNDCPFQKLIFNHPHVRIYNSPNIFSSIGEKENYAIELTRGEIIVVWDDDDIAMPWHLQNIEKYWKNNTNLLHWGKGVYYNEPDEISITGIGNSGIVYSRSAWEAIGKSPLENAGGDMTLVNRIRALGTDKIITANPPDNEVSWWYRWRSAFNYHQSGQGTDTPDRPNIVKRNAEYVEGLRKKGVIPEGLINLQPKWGRDYKKMLEKYVSRIHNTNV